MDFGSLLHVAQKNGEKAKNEVRYYSTKFEPPKKEERSKQLSSNIKKFLARKEAEEKQKAVAAKVKKDELLALRSQDKKSTRRVAVMLKRTKSANKSVISDAIDNDNTAVTLAGPSQPDEDDYGYVSQEASAFYNKMMQKYNTTPDEEKFPKAKRTVNTNLTEIKDRVRAAILKEQEDALLPHKRKRKHKEKDANVEEEKDENKCKETYKEPEPEKKVKPKPRPAPPIMNFNDLLKIAEKKQFEPIKIEPKVVDKERPMTKKQRSEFEKEKAWKDKKEIRDNLDKASVNKSTKLAPSTNNYSTNGRIPKLSNSDDRPALKIPKLSSSSDDRNSQRPSISNSKPIFKRPEDRSLDRGIPNKNTDKSIKRIDDKSIPRSRPEDKTGFKNSNSISGSRPDPNKVSKLRAELEKNRDPTVNKHPSSQTRPSSTSGSSNLNRTVPPFTSKTNTLDRKKALVKNDLNNGKPRQFPPTDLKPKQFPTTDLKPKQFPPTDVKPKQFPTTDLKPKQFPPTDVRPKFNPKNMNKKPMGHKMRILDDDESEYDSELDDFIDDGQDGEEDYSKYISEIFGYDKSRYRHEDFDDANMESSFSQVMKEEVMSSKLGLMEDLEDMKLEAEQKKQKALMKKKMMRK